MRLASLFLLLTVAGPLAAQPADSLFTPEALTRWTRADSAGIGFERLPLRTVREVAALLPGVRRDLGTGTLVGRGGAGLGEEPTFVVDGFRVEGGALVPFEAVEAVAVMTGYVPARYGEAAGGLVRVETREGGPAYAGGLEAITSEGLDAYGYNRAAFSLGGPLGATGLGGFFFSGELARLGDASPWGADHYRLSDEAYAALLANPQRLRAENGAGEVVFVPFPADLPPGTTAEALLGDPAAYDVDVPEGYTLVSGQPIYAAETFTAEDFELARAKDDPLVALTLHGGLTLAPSPGVEVRLGGIVDRERAPRAATPAERYGALFFNRDRLYEAERDAGRFYGQVRHRLSPTASYRLGIDYQRRSAVRYPLGFSDDLVDALRYGDADDPANEVATRYVFANPSTGLYEQRAADGSFGVGGAYGAFQLPGALNGVYQRWDTATLQFSGGATTQLGVNHLAFGAEFEQRTHRFFSVAPSTLARYVNDASGPESAFPGMPEGGVNAYAELPYAVFESLPSYAYYGYAFNGLEEVDGQDLAAFGAGESFDVAPYEPIYYAGYVQDEIAYRDLVIDLGLRLEAYDANALALRDIFAPLPIIRAGDLDAFDTFAAHGIGADYAAYFANTNDLSTVVGFRDLDGGFYDLQGERTTQNLIDAAGQVNITSMSLTQEAVTSTPLRFVVAPRVGVEVAVSERARVFAYVNRLARRPSPALYAPVQAFNNFTIGQRVGNANLAPEVTDAYGLGVSFDASGVATLTAAFFLHQSENLIQLYDLNQIGAPDHFAYFTPLNRGEATIYGVDLAAQTRRVAGFAGRAGYTLAFAEASYPADPFLEAENAFVTTADFDTRHALDLVADYRVADAAGLFLGGLGVSAAFSAQGGLPYTPAATVGNAQQPGPLPLAGPVNSARLPWTAQLDVRFDKRFALGTAALTAFLWVENVLGTENVLAVYRYTGQSDDDGFLDSSLGQSYLGGALFPEAAAFQYGTFTGGPVNVGGSTSTSGPLFYGQPRQVRLGVRFGL